LLGETSDDARDAPDTVMGVEPTTWLTVAVMIVPPVCCAVTTPFDEAALETLANVGAAELQTTLLVASAVVPSDRIAVAWKCLVNPTGTVGLVGVTSTDATL